MLTEQQMKPQEDGDEERKEICEIKGRVVSNKKKSFVLLRGKTMHNIGCCLKMLRTLVERLR
jgi:hypothetical protein